MFRLMPKSLEETVMFSNEDAGFQVDHAAASVCSKLPEFGSMYFSLAQLSELGLIRIAAVSPMLRHAFPALGVAGVPPAFAQQSPSFVVTHERLLRYN